MRESKAALEKKEMEAKKLIESNRTTADKEVSNLRWQLDQSQEQNNQLKHLQHMHDRQLGLRV